MSLKLPIALKPQVDRTIMSGSSFQKSHFTSATSESIGEFAFWRHVQMREISFWMGKRPPKCTEPFQELNSLTSHTNLGVLLPYLRVQGLKRYMWRSGLIGPVEAREILLARNSMDDEAMLGARHDT